ncbi:MAG: aldehyde ferredoxin oxidoreductase [Deltaproteobacteria bacterium]|nr:aldehyde ferredoxin oxidoreductase [Deltaproteobacteria bacterium]
MINEEAFRVLVVNLTEGKSEPVLFGSPAELLGGSGLAAGLFASHGIMDAPADHPDQPLIFAIGPLTAYFPLMSKVVLGFKSPYNGQYAESHAGGRLGLALRFAGYDALVIKGVAQTPSCLIVGSRSIGIRDVHYLWGLDVLSAGKHLRRFCGRDSGHRSILRIGPAGERGVTFASVNVDTYRHFGRLGGGAAMGAKRLKGIIVLGDGSSPLPEGKAYRDLYKTVYQEVTQTPAMKKYHDLGTLENMLPLNELHAVPWRNLQATHDENVRGITGQRFAEELLLRKTACSGCPVGCIHVGLLREQFAEQNEFQYRQVSYDHEPVFAAGSMLGVTKAGGVLTLLEEMERQGLDVMSAGVALAWATEAFERGILTDKETVVPLSFGDVEKYREAVRHLGLRTNDFYHLLGQGALAAAARYGGSDFACVLGQEMAGYATGEVFFASHAYGFRHSHLDSAGYSYDQKADSKKSEDAVAFLIEEERRRVQLTCMVSCLFARNVYSEERLQECLSSIGRPQLADSVVVRSRDVQARRWQLKYQTGYNPGHISIPKRFGEVTTWKGPVDMVFMDAVALEYQNAVRKLADAGQGVQSP